MFIYINLKQKKSSSILWKSYNDESGINVILYYENKVYKNIINGESRDLFEDQLKQFLYLKKGLVE